MKPSKALKTLLWVSELKETKAKEDFQRGRRALRELEEMLAEIKAKPQQLYDQITGRELSGEELRWFAERVNHTLEEKHKVERILKEKEREVESLRQKALRLHKRRRIAETLYRKAREAYLRELEENEMKTLEDLVLMRRQKDESL